jgi:hypothetical protein
MSRAARSGQEVFSLGSETLDGLGNGIINLGCQQDLSTHSGTHERYPADRLVLGCICEPGVGLSPDKPLTTRPGIGCKLV